MAAEEVQWLDLKDLDAVLGRAKAEGWTELALLAGDYVQIAASDLQEADWPITRVFILTEPLEVVPELLMQLTGLTSLDLEGNQIGDAGAEALARLTSLTWLDLQSNRIGDAGAKSIARLTRLTSLYLGDNQIGDAGAVALAQLTSLGSLNLSDNQISDAGVEAIARLTSLEWLGLGRNQIGEAGGRAILDAWADPATSARRRVLVLRDNKDLGGLLPAEVLEQTDAQVIIAAWRRRQEQEALAAPLPDVEALGEPAPTGAQVAVGADGRLTLVDRPLAEGARDDALARELHEEVVAALERLILAAGRSNVVAEWREVAEAARERLGSGPPEVRVSATLRIERLRSLREADERRRAEPDPLVEPAEAGVAAALRDAVAAANLYIQTDPHLAEQQRRLADPGLDIEISTEEAEAAEGDLEALAIADPSLLEELRVGRETAAMGGSAAERAQAWLAGTWRNVVREMLRQVLAWILEQVKAARASAGEAAMQAKLGTVITVEEAAAVLAATGHHGRQAAAATARAGAAGLQRFGGGVATGAGMTGGSIAVVGMVFFLEQQFALLTRLGWQPDFTALLARVLGL